MPAIRFSLHMIERIDRSDDEQLYQPRIHSRLIRDLYRVKLKTGLPLTVLVDLAIKDYLASLRDEYERTPPSNT